MDALLPACTVTIPIHLHARMPTSMLEQPSSPLCAHASVQCCEAVLHALVAGLGSEEEGVVTGSIYVLYTLTARPGAGSEELKQRLLEGGIAPQLDFLWTRMPIQHALLEEGREEGSWWPEQGRVAMALCAGLVRLPGLAAALVAFEAPATLAAAAKGFADACEAGTAAGGPALAVLRACARELAGGSAWGGAGGLGAGMPMSSARVGCLASVASRLLDGLGALEDTWALVSAAGQEAVAALSDVLACAPAELVGAIDWADAAPRG
jgi:hypothetical protein